MVREKPLRVWFKAYLIVYLIPLLFGALLFSQLFDIALRRTLEERGRDKIVRLVGYKGIAGIFDVLKKKKEKS